MKMLARLKNDWFSEVLLYYLILVSIIYFVNVFNTKGAEVLLINGNHSYLLDVFFRFITHFGNGLLFIPLIIFACFRSYRFAFLGISVWLLHGLFCLVMKQWFFAEFKRPAALLDNTLLHFVEGVTVHHHHSFPSGHTATIFCLAIFVSLVFKNRMVSLLMLVLALAVGYSRIYLLQHFLEDVLAGAVVGSATSFFLYYYFATTKFPPWMNSKMSINFRPRLIGPSRSR